MILVLPAPSGFGFGFFFFLSQEASVLVQRCELGTLVSGLGKSLAPQRDCAGWQLGTYFLERVFCLLDPSK